MDSQLKKNKNNQFAKNKIKSPNIKNRLRPVRSTRKKNRPSTLQKNDSLIIISDSDENYSPSPRKKRRTQSIEVLEEPVSEILISDDEDLLSDNEEIKPAQNEKSNQIKQNPITLESDNEVLTDDEEETKNTKRLELDNINDLLTDDEDEKPNFETQIKKEKTVKTEKLQNIKTEHIKTEWNDYEIVAQQQDIKINVSKHLIKLFQDGNTIPFIARYRRDQTENMPPEKLREVKDTFDEICHLKQKIQTVIKTLDKKGVLEKNLEHTIRCARSLEELEIIYAPYKPGPKRSLAERAKELGLEQPAKNMLNNEEKVILTELIDKSKKELSTVEGIQKGIVHIIAQMLATDSDVLSYLRQFIQVTIDKEGTNEVIPQNSCPEIELYVGIEYAQEHSNAYFPGTNMEQWINYVSYVKKTMIHLRSEVNFTLETKRLKVKKPTTKKSTTTNKPVDEMKFENYFDYKIPTKFVKPHQILAINRGEHHKILSVKIIVPDFVFQRYSKFCNDKWTKRGNFDILRKAILDEAIKDSYNRLVQPLVVREIRSELKSLAEKASYEVFSKNLKSLLLLAPLKGQPILAIDPGFTGGCKIALVSKTGSVLAFNWIYPHENRKRKESATILKNMLKEFDCSLIALGNGTACRETEEWLTEFIKTGFFSPLNVKYTIVNEDGASIYSCSTEARKEFPKLDTNIISAVSLARRIQDPLAELVKIEPQHLGVGMYQHDLKKKTLEEALNEVVSECVSFVGVDLNTASQCLLRRIAGLSDKRATQIVDYRARNGQFLYRDELKKVFGIGERTYQQCAGFLRVGPTSSDEADDFYKKPKTTKLDCTYIHPESYDIANKFMKKFNLNPGSIGESHFITKVKSLKVDTSALSKEFNTPEETVKLIMDAFSKVLNYDLRSEISQEPLFRQSIMNMNDLKVHTRVTGRVKNVTHFGCFIDIGVGTDALLHQSKMKGISLNIGDKIEAVVESLDINRKRIGLKDAFLI